MIKPTQAEFETVALCVGVEAIDDTINYAILDLRSDVGGSEVVFQSSIHRDLFLIRILDFATEKADPKLTGTPGSCLDSLIAVTAVASFDCQGSVNSLKHSTNALKEWLDGTTHYEMWLPSLDLDTSLSIQRSTLLRISANQAKHNLSRLTGVSKTVKSALLENGYDIPVEQIPLALDDFREHLHNDYFPFYCTWLTEMMNNIRWGIYDYLFPQFVVSYRSPSGGSPAYSFEIPPSVTSELHRKWFWRLMNKTREKPYLPRFRAPEHMKKRDIH